jgi:hypothetical protein
MADQKQPGGRQPQFVWTADGLEWVGTEGELAAMRERILAEPPGDEDGGRPTMLFGRPVVYDDDAGEG